MYTFHSFNIFSETALPRPPAVPQHHHSQAVMPWQYLALALQRYYIFLKNRPIIHQKPRICISIIYIFDIFRRGGDFEAKKRDYDEYNTTSCGEKLQGQGIYIFACLPITVDTISHCTFIFEQLGTVPIIFNFYFNLNLLLHIFFTKFYKSYKKA